MNVSGWGEGLWRVMVGGWWRGGWWVGEGEKSGGEKVDSDQPLPPQPAVITMCLNVCTPLWVIVKVTQLHGGKVI